MGRHGNPTTPRTELQTKSDLGKFLTCPVLREGVSETEGGGGHLIQASSARHPGNNFFLSHKHNNTSENRRGGDCSKHLLPLLATAHLVSAPAPSGRHERPNHITAKECFTPEFFSQRRMIRLGRTGALLLGRKGMTPAPLPHVSRLTLPR